MAEDPEKKPVSLETLNKHLDEVKKLRPQTDPDAKPPGDSARAAIDFASATAVGTLLGYGVDVWLHTLPFGILGGLVIGTAAGLKMMFRDIARQEQSENAKKKND